VESGLLSRFARIDTNESPSSLLEAEETVNSRQKDSLREERGGGALVASGISLCATPAGRTCGDGSTEFDGRAEVMAAGEGTGRTEGTTGEVDAAGSICVTGNGGGGCVSSFSCFVFSSVWSLCSRGAPEKYRMASLVRTTWCGGEDARSTSAVLVGSVESFSILFSCVGKASEEGPGVRETGEEGLCGVGERFF